MMGSLGDQPRTLYKDDERFKKYLHEQDIVWNMIVETCLASAERKYYNCAGNSVNKDLLNAIDLIVLQQYRLEILRKVTTVMSDGSARAWNLVTGDLGEIIELEEASALLTICAEARRAPDDTEDMEDTRMPTMEDFQAKHPRPEWIAQAREGALASVGTSGDGVTAEGSIPSALTGRSDEAPSLPEKCETAPAGENGTLRRSKRKRRENGTQWREPPSLVSVARPPSSKFIDLTKDSDSNSTVRMDADRKVKRAKVEVVTRRTLRSGSRRAKEGMVEMQDGLEMSGGSSSNSILPSLLSSRRSSRRSKNASLPRMVRNRTLRAHDMPVCSKDREIMYQFHI